MSGIKGRLREWPYAVLGLSLLWMTVRALEKMLSSYAKDFDQDPLKHNVYAYTAPSFGAMLHQIKNLYQPALDFALRRYLVFPTLGFDERAFRVPGSICYLLALGLVPALIYAFLRKQEHPSVVAVSGALLGAFWILENKLLLAYGVEGRHYMAAAFVSMIWFCCAFLFESKPHWAFFLSSLIFANTHLFSFPLIATAFGIHAVRCCWER
ncbi:MAG TPA: hypothetical protein VL137_00990, partial [Polyangiaceae bacterium]|nr:hypothetical protein [Polyangiaceae bacterium]